MSDQDRWSQYLIESLRIIGPDRTSTYTPKRVAEIAAQTADALLVEYMKRFESGLLTDARGGK